MVSLLTKRLLREWKTIVRSSHDRQGLYFIKPQDSNMCIWDLVITEPVSNMEIYMQLFISDSDGGDAHEPFVILRCLTPNNLLPINKNISLTHLSHIIIEEGFNAFLMNIWHTFFGFMGQNSNIKKKNSIINPLTSRAWNRIMCKSFKHQFPELVGILQPGDYQAVKNYSKWLHSTNIIDTNTFINTITSHSYNKYRSNTSTHTLHTNTTNYDNIQNLTTTTSAQASLCSDINLNVYPFWKRQRIILKDNGNDDYNDGSRSRKRTKY